MKILFINTIIPQPDRASGCKRLCGILEILSKDHVIYFFAEKKSSAHSDDTIRLKRLGIKVIEGGYLELFFLLARVKLDACFIEFYSMAFKYARLIKKLQPSIFTIVDSVDVHFNRIKNEVSLNLVSHRYYQHEKMKELSVYREADCTLVVSKDDGNLLAEYGVRNYLIVSNIVPIRARVHRDRPTPVIIFIGGFKHNPNGHALSWFLDKPWKLIKKEIPDAQFKIIGDNLSMELRGVVASHNDVHYLGYVPNLDKIYDSGSVAIAPLTYGGGVKGKVNEAMAYGIPLVTTSVGIEGIPAIDSTHCYVADDPVNFAEKVIAIIKSKDIQSQFTYESQRLADQSCGFGNAKRQISQLVNIVKKHSNDTTHYKLSIFNILGFFYFLSLLIAQLVLHKIYRRAVNKPLHQ